MLTVLKIDPDLKSQSHTGLIIAAAVAAAWASMLAFLLSEPTEADDPLNIIFILVQMHLYTGLFITAHDAMHGTVSRNSRLNDLTGTICALLFAFNWFPRLKRNHQLHHNHVAEAADPDVHPGNFFTWYLRFLRQYITWWQMVLMALIFNLLIMIFPEENVILFWMLPAILATFQLFIFGTWIPHKGLHSPENRHKSRSLPKNHLLAFVTCYFFGYHYEHHDKPHLPWWQLWKAR